MSTSPTSGMANCIQCACHDLCACEGGCYWLRVDYRQGKGVCSECAEHVARWDAGDRTMTVPVNDNMPVISKALTDAWSQSGKDANASGYIVGMVDMLFWLGELTEAQRVEMLNRIGSHAELPPVPSWVAENA